jgi:hypothetical protein
MKIFIKIRHILVAISALSFLFLFFSWNLCIPFGCSVDPFICDSGNCIGESFDQHIKERSILSNIAPKAQLPLQMVILFALFIIFKHDIKLEYFSILQRLKFNRNKFLYKLYNIFIIFFSKGILHPKTF